MLKFYSSFLKETIVLIRDLSGLLLLFLMPAALILIMSLVQDAPFRDYQESDIPLLFIDNDRDELGAAIEKGLIDSKIFTLQKQLDGAVVTENMAKAAIARGDYQIGIIIPKRATELMKKKVKRKVTKTLSELGLAENKTGKIEIGTVELTVFFDPATKKSFKSAVLSSLYRFTSEVESQTILKSFSDQLATGGRKADFDEEELVSFKEVYPSDSGEEKAVLMNSVQHNVPAWTVFAMFFIVIPLAGNMIRERERGSFLRLMIMPVNFSTIFGGKLALYILVCLVQMAVMLMVGFYLLPLFGLPKLQAGSNILALAVLGFSAATAATGYGLLVGTLFPTYQQATSFGAISVIILAALGGIWVPVYVMPHAMQEISAWSPLNWGLNAFNDLFLRNGNLDFIIPDVVRLLGFGIITTFIAIELSSLKKQRI